LSAIALKAGNDYFLANSISTTGVKPLQTTPPVNTLTDAEMALIKVQLPVYHHQTAHVIFRGGERDDLVASLTSPGIFNSYSSLLGYFTYIYFRKSQGLPG
jgi:hypothetical protein